MAGKNSFLDSGLLDELNAELDKCVRCGECRSVCPVYEQLKLEKFTSRGRIALLDAITGRDLDLTNPLGQALDNCIMCLACQEKCGSRVRTERIIPLARAMVSRKQGLPLIKNLVIKGLTHPEKAIRQAALLEPLAFKSLPKESGLRRRFPLPYVDQDQFIPKLEWPGFRARSPEVFPARAGKATVSFFTGCLANHAFGNQAQNLVKLLNSLGVSVQIPKQQICCGAPMHVNGELTIARENALKNLEALSERPTGQKIVILCASCGFTLKKVYPHLLADSPELAEQARAMADDVMDISEFLLSQFEPKVLEKHFINPLSQSLTYHDPCHLARGQGVVSQPRHLINLVSGGGLIEMEKPGQCCGSGGTYGLVHKDVSQQILKAKIDRAAKTGAELIATGCPACMIQLKSGVLKWKTGQKVVHTVDLLTAALGDE